MWSFEGEEFNFEDQGRVSWDESCDFLVAVGVGGWAGESGLLADTHLGDSFVPASDDLPLSEDELKWFSAISGAVEFLAIEKSANVVDGDFVSGLGFLAVSWLDGLNLKGHLKDLNDIKNQMVRLFTLSLDWTLKKSKPILNNFDYIQNFLISSWYDLWLRL